MPKPEGGLTGPQFEIMQCVWASDEGLTVAEIWDHVGRQRAVGRTTTLNLVDRLEKRGWLKRRKVNGVFRYRPAVERANAEAELANDFVSDFFDGSPSDLVLRLLGANKISREEWNRLKLLLDETSPEPTKGAAKKKRGKK